MKTPRLAAASLFVLAPFARADQSAAPRFVPDCADVLFQPEDPSVSKPAALSSQEWFTDCVPDGPRGEDCWERPGPTDDLTVRLSLSERKPLLPWETDAFRVCLTGPVLRTEVVSAAYDYTIVRDGAVDGLVVLAPGAKRLLPPDPGGVSAALTPGLTLRLQDRWAAYYPGEEIAVKIALRKEASFWPDETVVETEAKFPAAASYAAALNCPGCAPGAVYYARYSIRRLGGRVSTEAETPVLQTGKVAYLPE